MLNVELVKALDAALAGRDVRFEWVKGHNGHDLNEKADELARAAATAFRDGMSPKEGPGFGGGVVRSHPVVAPTPKPEPEPDLFSLPETQQAGSRTPRTAPSRTPASPPAQPGLWPKADLSAEQEVVALQSALLSEDVLLDRERLGELLHPDYVGFEVGGQIRTRGSLLARAASLPGRADLQILGVNEFGPDAVQLRYRMRRSGEESLCSSLWRRDSSGWRIVFHQETAS